jgi:hypothetical protein
MYLKGITEEQFNYLKEKTIKEFIPVIEKMVIGKSSEGIRCGCGEIYYGKATVTEIHKDFIYQEQIIGYSSFRVFFKEDGKDLGWSESSLEHISDKQIEELDELSEILFGDYIRTNFPDIYKDAEIQSNGYGRFNKYAALWA